MNNENHTYQTGRTQPPKSHQGLIALLLILVILLAGVVSALSLMNIHLFRMLEEKNSQSVRFSPETEGVAAMALEEPEGIEGLGINGQEFTPLYRSYQAWPQGIYICKISPDSPAAESGLQIGDILVAINDTTISDGGSFQQAVAALTPGKAVTLTVFRDGEELTISIPKL